MANKCGCGKRIPRGSTHCGSCARSGGGYQSNMAAELARAERDLAAKQLAEAKADARRAERQKQIAERQASAKAAQQKRKHDEEKRVADLKAARKISNARNRPVPQQEPKKGWW